MPPLSGTGADSCLQRTFHCYYTPV
jgi:hypothetical protein